MTALPDRTFDAPLGRRDLAPRLEPATRLSGDYRGGTLTRESGTACFAASRPLCVRTHHAGTLLAVGQAAQEPLELGIGVRHERWADGLEREAELERVGLGLGGAPAVGGADRIEQLQLELDAAA